MVYVAETFAQIFEPLLSHLGQRLRVEQRCVRLVDLGVDVAEHLLQSITLERAVRRREAGSRFLIREVLHDRRSLRQHLAVVELQRGHVTLRVDREIVLAARGLLRGDVDLLEVELDAGFVRDDVRRQRAGAGSVVELHALLLIRASPESKRTSRACNEPTRGEEYAAVADLPSPRRVLLASLVGTTIEFFDFYIYGTAAVLVFPALFF